MDGSVRFRKTCSSTNIDRHLIHMDTLLDTKFRNQHIEGSVQDADDPSSPNHRTILQGQVRNEYTEVQMGGLLPRKSSTLLLAVGEEYWSAFRIWIRVRRTCYTAEQPWQQRHGLRQIWVLRGWRVSQYGMDLTKIHVRSPPAWRMESS